MLSAFVGSSALWMNIDTVINSMCIVLVFVVHHKIYQKSCFIMQNVCVSMQCLACYTCHCCCYIKNGEFKSNSRSNSREKPVKSSPFTRRKGDRDSDREDQGQKSVDINVASKDTRCSNPALSKQQDEDAARRESVAYVGCDELFADILSMMEEEERLERQNEKLKRKTVKKMPRIDEEKDNRDIERESSQLDLDKILDCIKLDAEENRVQ